MGRWCTKPKSARPWPEEPELTSEPRTTPAFQVRHEVENVACEPDGRVAYSLKKTWRDGSTHVVMEPQVLIGARDGGCRVAVGERSA
jgi:hypothetical protein